MSFFQSEKSESVSIFNDLRIALCAKPVLMLLTLSISVRIVVHFFFLPNSPSVAGPDEGTYALLAKYASQGLPMEEFPLYGAGLYNSAKSITLPSALLVQLGIDELNAVRITASAYGLFSSLGLALCFLAVSSLRRLTPRELNPLMDRKIVYLLTVFTFFPSNFVWSTIGLRESGSQFWLIATFYLILKSLHATGLSLWKFTFFSSLALTMAYGARPETALVFSVVALLVSIILLVKIRKFLPVVAISLGIFAGQTFTTTPRVTYEETFLAFKIIEPGLTQNPTANSDETLEALPNDSASSVCKLDQEIIQYGEMTFRCKLSRNYQVVERSPVNTLEKQIFTAQVLEYKREVNSLDAQSALPANDCQGLSRGTLRLIECSLLSLPYRLFAFLFRPLIFFDQGSATLTFAALENLAWMILIPLAIWVSLGNRDSSVDRFINLSLTSYVLLFASAAALYEGNLGTAFRHKSTILWPLIFILMITPRIWPKLKRETKPLC